MFCPKCRAEHREGFSVCSDCNVDLVHELPPEPEPECAEHIGYEEVLATYNPTDIAIMKSLLDAQGITYFFHGEHPAHVKPPANPARLMVKKDEAALARDLLERVEIVTDGCSS